MYVLDERDIYIDALNGLGVKDAKSKFDAFSSEVREQLTKEWLTRQAMNDSLILVASVAQALTHEREEAHDWLRNLRKDIIYVKQKQEIGSFKEIVNVPSLKWDKRNTLSMYTRNMRDDFKQMLMILWALKHSTYEARTQEETGKLRDLLGIAQRLSSVAADVLSDEASGPKLGDVMGQLDRLMAEVAIVMSVADGQGNRDLTAFTHGLKEFGKLLDYAKERDWVGIGFDISDNLKELNVKDAEYQNSLRFSMVLLSMYQAESVEEAKGIFHAALENESSREARYKNLAFDVGALAGANIGYGWQQWDSGQSDRNNGLVYGIFAPFGVMGTYKCFGGMLYPVDLGGYLSGTAGDTPAVREQSALHAGLAFYVRPWAHIPLVFGAAGDYKPRFAADDSKQTRVFGFAALELPLYIIH